MKSILRQASWLLGAQLLGRVVGLFYTIFLARNLGVTDFGLYSVALAYYSIALSVADFGFNRFLIREVAADHKNMAKFLLNTCFLRVLMTSVLFAIFSISLYIMDPDKLRVSLTLLAVLAVVPQSLSLTIDAIFISLQKLEFSAIAMLFLNLSTALVGVFLVSGGLGPTGAVVAFASGQLFYLFLLLLLGTMKKIPLISEVNLSVFKEITKGSLPYGILAVLGLLYFRIDLLFLTYIKGNYDGGLYGAAYKFLEAVIFIPSALGTALFPVVARLHNVNSRDIKGLYFKSISVMFLVGIILLVFYLTILPVIIRLILPSYIASIPAIKILAFAIPFIFIHVPGAQILLATDKYLKPILWLSVLTLSFNVVSNLIFIPSFGILAASWVTVASEALSFLVFFKLLKAKVL